MVKTNLWLVKISAIFIVLAILQITNVPGHSAQIDRCSQKLLKLSWLAKIDKVHIFCLLLDQSVWQFTQLTDKALTSRPGLASIPSKSVHTHPCWWKMFRIASRKSSELHMCKIYLMSFSDFSSSISCNTLIASYPNNPPHSTIIQLRQLLCLIF